MRRQRRTYLIWSDLPGNHDTGMNTEYSRSAHDEAEEQQGKEAVPHLDRVGRGREWMMDGRGPTCRL